MECFRGSVCTFDTPSVPGIDGALFVAPIPPLAAGTQDGREMVRDVHAPRRGGVRNASGPELTGCAVVAVGSVPAPGFRRIAPRQCLPVRTPYHVLAGVVFEPLNRKAARILAPHRSAGRYDVSNATVLQGGIDTARSIGRISSDLPGEPTQCRLHGVHALGEATGIMLFAGHHLDIDYDASMIIDGGVLLIAWPQGRLGRRRHSGARVGRTELLMTACGT